MKFLDSNKLAVAAPPQLYTPVAGITPSVITRLQRPSIPPSFNAQGMYFANFKTYKFSLIFKC